MIRVRLALSLVALGTFVWGGCSDEVLPGPPPTAPPMPPAPRTIELVLEDVPVYGAVIELAERGGLSAVVDPGASEHATCARVTVVVPAPRPIDEVIGLVGEALRPSGFELSRRPAGLMLRHDGTTVPPGCARLVAPAIPSPPPESDAPPLTPDVLDRAIVAVSDTEYLISAGAVEELFTQERFMRSARIIPNMENGRPHGLRLYGIRPSSLAGRLGIDNGDTLLTVNGHDLTGPDTALEAYAASRGATRFELEIERRGARRTHVYRIVERLPSVRR